MYSQELKIRNDTVDGVELEWLWPKNDTGAWDGPKDDWITSHKAIYQKYVKNFDIVIQAGGNCGLYPKLFSKMFKVVYTFEPDPFNFHCLVNNCQDDNIIKFNCALGDKHMMMAVDRISKTNVGMNKMIEAENAYIPVLRLDDFNFPCVDLIQLDVEGFEINIFYGAKETIRIHNPIITCENGRPEMLETLKEINDKYEILDRSKADTVYGIK